MMYQFPSAVQKIFLTFVLTLAFCPALFAQTADWETLPNAPFVSRFNDVFFATPEIGWIVNGDGEIYRTTDGGAGWQLQRLLRLAVRGAMALPCRRRHDPCVLAARLAA